MSLDQTQDTPQLYHKSRLGLMLPVYLAAPSQRATRAPQASSGLFNPYTVKPLGSPPEAVAVGRWTAGGQNYVALSTSSSGSSDDRRVHIFTQSGGLSRVQWLDSGAGPIALASGYLDGDDWHDLAVVNKDASTLGVYIHQPDPNAMDVMRTYPTCADPDAVAVGDFNSDLRQDVAVSCAVNRVLAIHYQQADGALAAPLLLSLDDSSSFNDLDSGDLNSDGYDDLALLRGSGRSMDHVAVFYQQDHALGATPVYLTAYTGGGNLQAHSLAVGDVTDDGRDDVVVTGGGNMPEAFLSVFAQQPDGALPATPSDVYAAYHVPESVAIGDVNHDGRNDVLVLHTGWSMLTIYTQHSGGGLNAYVSDSIPYSGLYRPGALALGDVTGDGALDALIASRSGVASENGLLVLTNATGSAPTSLINQPPVRGDYLLHGSSSYSIQGSSSGASSVQVSTNGGQNWNTVAVDPAWSYDWSPPADGSYIILSRAVNGGRTQSLPARTRLIVDQTLPVAEMDIDGNAKYTTIPTVTLTITATDVNGIDAMCFANHDGDCDNWQAPVVTRTWVLSESQAVGPLLVDHKTVWAHVRDNSGNITTTSDSIILDQLPPEADMVIDDDAEFTTFPTVTLTITATDANGIDAMCFANHDGDCEDWQSPVVTRTWVLSESQEVGTLLIDRQAVWVHVRDEPGNTTVTSDTIILDQISPTVEMVINDGALYTTIPTVTLTITASDANGIDVICIEDQECILCDGQTSVVITRTWVLRPAQGSLTLRIDPRTVSVLVRDVPGNVAVASDSIILDQVAPEAELRINDGAEFTTIPTVTLTITASDVNGIGNMRFANQDGDYGDWQNPVITRTWVLSGVDGLKTVLAQVRDLPGNVVTASDTITLDRVAPSGSVVINDDDPRVGKFTVKLTINGTDATSGLCHMRIRNAGDDWGEWQPFATSVKEWELTGSGGIGYRRVEAQLRDCAGNESAIFSDDIWFEALVHLPFIVNTPPPSWQEIGPGSASGGGISDNDGDSRYADMALSPDDTPYIVWQDDSSGNWEINLLYWDESAWQTLGGSTIICATGGSSQHPAVAIGPDGKLYVAWEQGDGSGNAEIYVLHWDGVQWATLGGAINVSNNGGDSAYPDVAVGPDGKLYLAWHDNTLVRRGLRGVANENYEIYVKCWDGSAWRDASCQADGVSNVSLNGGSSQYPSLAVDAAGVLYTAWKDNSYGNDEIHVKYLDGSAWKALDGADDGDNVSRNSASSWSPSIAALATDDVYVAWHDHSRGLAEIYVKHWDGQRWGALNGSASEGGVSDTLDANSKDPSIAAAPDGQVYVSWAEQVNGNTEIYVKRWDEANWGEIGVGSASGAGISNNAGESLCPVTAVTTNGTPFVAWHDDSDGNDEIYVRRWR